MRISRYFRIRHFLKVIKLLLRESTQKYNNKICYSDSILIIKIDGIGDYFHFRNFLQVVKESNKFKNYRITLCANEQFKDIAMEFDSDCVHEFIWVNRKEFANSFKYREKIINIIRQNNFKNAVNPSYSREVIIGDSIIRAAIAKNKIGCIGDTTNDILPLILISDLWYTNLFKIDIDSIFEFERNRRFFELFIEESIDIKEPFLNLPVQPKHNQIIFFPGAGEKIKQWPTSFFAELANRITSIYKIPILICGSEKDSEIAEDIILKSGNKDLHNHCGKTNLTELLILITHSRILITNDSSAFHMGAVSGTQTICLLMGRHYGRFAPYPINTKQNLHLIFPKSFLDRYRDMKLAETDTKHNSPSKIEEITVEEVFEKLKSLL